MIRGFQDHFGSMLAWAGKAGVACLGWLLGLAFGEKDLDDYLEDTTIYQTGDLFDDNADDAFEEVVDEIFDDVFHDNLDEIFDEIFDDIPTNPSTTCSEKFVLVPTKSSTKFQRKV